MTTTYPTCPTCGFRAWDDANLDSHIAKEHSMPAPETIHYQVTDTESLCDTRTSQGTTVEARVNCPACRAILATYGD